MTTENKDKKPESPKKEEAAQDQQAEAKAASSDVHEVLKVTIADEGTAL